MYIDPLRHMTALQYLRCTWCVLKVHDFISMTELHLSRFLLESSMTQVSTYCTSRMEAQSLGDQAEERSVWFGWPLLPLKRLRFCDAMGMRYCGWFLCVRSASLTLYGFAKRGAFIEAAECTVCNITCVRLGVEHRVNQFFLVMILRVRYIDWDDPFCL